MSNNTLIKPRDANFFKNVFPYKIRIYNSIPNENLHSKPPFSSNNEYIMVEPRGKKARIEKESDDDLNIYKIEDTPKLIKKL